VSLAVSTFLPLVSVTPVLQLPSLATSAVPSGVVTLSNTVTVDPGAVTSLLTVPDTVWFATAVLVLAAGVVMATVGGVVSSVKVTGRLVPVPAALVSVAVSTLLPLLRVTLVLQLPSLATSAVPTWVVPSSTVTVLPASATSTVPAMGWLVWLVSPPWV